MTSDLDSRITSQLALHRGMHSLAMGHCAMLRELLMQEKLRREVENLPPSLKVAQGLESIDRYCELAEKITPEIRAWT